MIEKNTEFIESLMSRIDVLREKVSINQKNQVRGVRFKDTGYITNAIQGAVIVGLNPDMKGMVMREAGGLEFQTSQVKIGLYDPIIIKILSDCAVLDFKSENRIDLH